MKKTVLTFGLISGAISSVGMLALLPFLDTIGFEAGEIVGYTTLVLSALLVFFGIRSYRESVAAGRISFGRGFSVGLLITVISCACYVVTWEVVYFKIAPDFGDKYIAHLIAKEKASGASAEAVEKKTLEMAKFKEMYQNPLINAAITFIEPFPIGLAMAAVSAAILRKK